MVGISLLCDFVKLFLLKGQLGEIFSRLDILEASIQNPITIPSPTEPDNTVELLQAIQNLQSKVSSLETQLSKKRSIVDDYFYVNSDTITLATASKDYCFPPWNVQAFQTLDF